jgi:hypothetical protein
VLQALWSTGDVTLLPSTYAYQVIDVLNFLDASEQISDLELLGSFTMSEYAPLKWAVTITVNNIEPIGSVTCLFSNGNAHQVDLNEFD